MAGGVVVYLKNLNKKLGYQYQLPHPQVSLEASRVVAASITYTANGQTANNQKIYAH